MQFGWFSMGHVLRMFYADVGMFWAARPIHFYIFLRWSVSNRGLVGFPMIPSRLFGAGFALAIALLAWSSYSVVFPGRCRPSVFLGFVVAAQLIDQVFLNFLRWWDWREGRGWGGHQIPYRPLPMFARTIPILVLSLHSPHSSQCDLVAGTFPCAWNSPPFGVGWVSRRLSRFRSFSLFWEFEFPRACWFPQSFCDD